MASSLSDFCLLDAGLVVAPALSEAEGEEGGWAAAPLVAVARGLPLATVREAVAAYARAVRARARARPPLAAQLAPPRSSASRPSPPPGRPPV